MTRGEENEERVEWKPDTPRGLEPSYATFTPIEHYYGDSARELILGGTALMLLTSPLYADKLSLEFPFEVAGAIAAVCFAALTNPWKRWVLIGDAVLSGAAVVIFQGWAVLDFSGDEPVAFVFREAITLVAVFALYFSVKTVRAMALRQVGEQAHRGEFGGAAQKPSHKLPPPKPDNEYPYSVKDSPQGEDFEGS
jgi:hypothetical protein